MGGDNAGANIAHKIAMTVGKEGFPGGLKHQAWQGLGVLCCFEGSGWEGEAEVVEVEGEDHAFHIVKAETQKAKDLTKQVADFLLK
ncbi:2-hydroxyisoflavanone dehydratase-like [Prunus yedoensis var. nudiflora]|uniref:2-hydroxyisoflavanone dehydratase-like n=1 Tax=Prunus yedoensis var. nudiflora TaxID=2094558 RepID=A0A314ZTG9_PRUYE|nr:2-hydroxyisoflavanone dehydratase-like [Prunus yedoensis var. nudiflora]